MQQSNPFKVIKPSRCLIANLDILGIQNKMFHESKKERIEQLSILHRFIKEAKIGNPATKGLLEHLDSICFSDNIVVTYNTANATSEQDFKDKCHYLVLYILSLQALALIHGYFVRGSIKFGELYIDKEINFICGKGLVETYLEESQLAIYPRVITKDNELLKIIDDMSLQNGHTLKDIFIKDADGIFFLDFLQMFCISSDVKTQMEIAKDCYNKYFAKDRYINAKIQQKHDWHINYFNNFCDRNNFSGYKIELAEQQQQLVNEEIFSD